VSHEPDPSRSQSPGDDEPVPRLPRGRGLKLSFPEIMRILMILAMLIAVVALRRPCAENTGRFIQSFEPPADAGPGRTPGQLPPGRYIPLNGEMTEQELREKLELLTDMDAGASPGALPGALINPSTGPASSPSTGPAAGAAPAQPSEDTSHDREPGNAPDRVPSTPASGSREPR
jgi:hypothetical protein